MRLPRSPGSPWGTWTTPPVPAAFAPPAASRGGRMRSSSAARAHATKASLKHALLPAGAKIRRLPWGPARGVRMEIDFSCQTRLYLGLYETEVNRHLRALCRPGFAGFDVGGQSGYDALLI